MCLLLQFNEKHCCDAALLLLLSSHMEGFNTQGALRPIHCNTPLRFLLLFTAKQGGPSVGATQNRNEDSRRCCRDYNSPWEIGTNNSPCKAIGSRLLCHSSDMIVFFSCLTKKFGPAISSVIVVGSTTICRVEKPVTSGSRWGKF